MADLCPHRVLEVAPSRNIPCNWYRQSTYCLLNFKILHFVKVRRMAMGRYVVWNDPQGERVTTHTVIKPVDALLRGNYDVSTAIDLSLCPALLQLPDPSLYLNIVEHVSRVAADLITSGQAYRTGMSIDVTIEATTWREDATEFVDSMIYDAIETDVVSGTDVVETDRFGSIPATQASIESLEKVRLTVSEPEKQTQCSICLEEFEAGLEVTRMPCLHVYHGDCIVQWLQKSHMCPLCRFPLPQTS